VKTPHSKIVDFFGVRRFSAAFVFLFEDKPMSANNTVQELNRQLAGRINAEARSNPQSPYANKFIGLADGQVVVVAVDLDDYSG
jgi:hypothetical protein